MQQNLLNDVVFYIPYQVIFMVKEIKHKRILIK